MNIDCLTDRDVLATSAIITKQIACGISDTNKLALLTDIITAVGANLFLIVNQRLRFEQNCQDIGGNKTDTAGQPLQNGEKKST